MPNNKITLIAAQSAIAFAFTLGALNTGGCSSDDDSGSNIGPSTGTGGGSGATGTGGSPGGATGTGGGIPGTSGAPGTGGAPGTDGSPGTGGNGGGTAPVQNEDGSWTCTDATGTHTCRCSDGVDNDNDQTIDTLDPNCIAGPYVDSEEGSGTSGNCGTTQCSNCMDDDGDGLTDGADIECTGALDNEEASFATGISGDNSDACRQDCFFDGNSGSGNDGCLWNLKCDPENPGEHAEKECPYDPNYNNCQPQSDACIRYCAQYTPNGCDCFGCCTVIVDGVSHDVKLLPSCSADVIDDAALCPTCTKEASCNNTCEECEYCLGQVPDPSCAIGFPQPEGGLPPPEDAAPPPMQCPTGVTPCTPGVADSCPGGFYCLTGCCRPSIM